VAQEEISINSVLFVIVDELVKQRPFSDNVNRWNVETVSETWKDLEKFITHK
jgi:hypothetical protein